MAKILKFKRRQETNLGQSEELLWELYIKTTQAADVFIDRPELNSMLLAIHTDIELLLQTAGLVDLPGDDEE